MEINNNVRTLAKVERENIVVEVYKDATGKILRQQSFSLTQLEAQIVQTTKVYNDSLARTNEMIAIIND